MIRGTTPTHRFALPFDPAEMKELLLTYAQDGAIVLERRGEELSFSGRDGDWAVSHRLTQSESGLFRPGEPVRIQLRVLTQNDEALASEIVTVRVEDVLNDEVLT